MASLTAFINLVDKFSPNVNNMTKSTDVFSNTLGKLAKVAVGAFSTVAVTNFAKESFQAFTSFESKMNEVFTLLPGISGDAMADMTQQTKDFAKEFGVLPEKVVPALYQSISAGVPKDNVFDFLAVAQKAAVGGVTELETAVDGISSVINAYGTDVLSASQASDLMFTAVKNGKTDFSQLSQSLYNVIPTASSLGVEFGNVTAALASMTAQGTPTSVATTQLRQMFVELSKEGTKTSKVFKDISGKSFKEFIASGKNTQDALILLEGYAADTNVGINDLFGSVEAGNAALALTGKGTEGFTKNLADMADAAGATDEAYNTMDKGISRSIEKIKANFEVFKINLGEKFLPVVAAVSDKILEVMPIVQSAVSGAIDFISPKLEAIGSLIGEIINVYFSGLDGSSMNLKETLTSLVTGGFDLLKGALEWVRDNSDVVKGLIIGITTAYTIQKGIVLGLAIANGIKTASQWASIAADKAETIAIMALYAKDYILAGAQWAVTAAQWAMNSALLACPITWVVVAIAALVGALIYLYKNNETVRNAINTAWEWLKTNVISAVTAIKDWCISAWENIKAIVVPIVQSVADFIVKAWENIKIVSAFVWELIKSVVESVWVFISSIVQAYINIVVAVITTAWNVIKAVTTTVWNAITDFFTSVWNGIVNFMTPIIQGISDFISSTWETIKNVTSIVFTAISSFFTTIWSNIVNFLTPIITGIATFISTVWENIKTVTSTVWNLISQGLSTIWNFITSLVTTVISGWINIITGAWNVISTVSTTVWNGISSFFSYIWGIISGVFTSVTGAISSTVSSIWNTIKSTTSSIWNGISSVLSGVVNGIKNTISNVFNGILNVASSVWNSVKSAIMNPITAAVNFVKEQINKITGFFKNMKIEIPKIKLPHFSISGKFSLSPPSIPKLGVEWYAKGTNNAKKGPAIVGEKGPELLYMNGGEKVVPNNKTERMLNSSLSSGKGNDNIQPSTQQINQAVNYADVKEPNNFVQSIDQVVNAANIPEIEGQTQNVEQNIIQKLKSVNIPSIDDIKQKISQKLSAVNIPKVEDLTQRINQTTIQAKSSKPEDLSQSIIQNTIPDNSTKSLEDVSSPIIDKEKADTLRSTTSTGDSVTHNEKYITIEKLFDNVAIQDKESLKKLLEQLGAFLEDELFNGGDAVYEI